MNPVSAISWLWKSLRGHSVTFSVLMAFGLLGFSVVRWLKQGLGALGTPWLLVFILPTILIGLLAKREREWMPDEKRRKFWARTILGSAALLAIAVAFLKTEPKVTQPTQATGTNSTVSSEGAVDEPAQKSLRPRGPSGK